MKLWPYESGKRELVPVTTKIQTGILLCRFELVSNGNDNVGTDLTYEEALNTINGLVDDYSRNLDEEEGWLNQKTKKGQQTRGT